MAKLDFIKGTTTDEGGRPPHKMDFYRHTPDAPSLPSPEKQAEVLAKMELDNKKLKEELQEEKKEVELEDEVDGVVLDLPTKKRGRPFKKKD